MPRGKSSKPSPEASAKQLGRYHLTDAAGWGGFINIRLTEEDKNSFYDWYAENVAYTQQLLDELLGAGMKLGLAYDRENECYIATFTGRLVSNSEDRFCVTTRAGTFEETLALAVWKHVYFVQGSYDDYRPKTGKFDRWG